MIENLDVKHSLLLKHPEFPIKHLSASYPFSIAQIRKYKEALNWYYIHTNCLIPWSIDFIEEFKDYLFFFDPLNSQEPYWIHTNSSIPWSLELLEKFKDHWQWEVLQENGIVMDDEEMREYVYENIRELPQETESIHEIEPASKEPLRYYNHPPFEDTLVFETPPSLRDELIQVSNKITRGELKITYELITHYIPFWNWKILSIDHGLFLSHSEILQLSDKWFLGHYSKTNTGFQLLFGLVNNQAVSWNTSLTQHFKERLDWDFFTEHGNIAYSLEFLTEFENHINWSLLNNRAWSWICEQYPVELYLNSIFAQRVKYST